MQLDMAGKVIPDDGERKKNVHAPNSWQRREEEHVVKRGSVQLDASESTRTDRKKASAAI